MSGIDWLWEADRKLRKQYEQITAEKAGAKKKNLSSRFDRNKFAKIGHNKAIKDMYKLDTIYYNSIKL